MESGTSSLQDGRRKAISSNSYGEMNCHNAYAESFASGRDALASHRNSHCHYDALSTVTRSAGTEALAGTLNKSVRVRMEHLNRFPF